MDTEGQVPGLWSQQTCCEQLSQIHVVVLDQSWFLVRGLVLVSVNILLLILLSSSFMDLITHNPQHHQMRCCHSDT